MASARLTGALEEPALVGEGERPAAHQSGGWLDVWVEAGREGQVFTYAAPADTPIQAGDLVQVRLKGRRHAEIGRAHV